MTISAKIICDSISKHTNQRITTFELEMPRFILPEFNTHRQFSRNTASSRAIPVNVKCEQLLNNGAYPIHWGKNQSGMQAKEEINEESKEKALEIWENAKLSAIEYAKQLHSLGVHKQITNRILEPFETVKTLVTATNYDNFFNLRCHSDAQPEIKALADLMYAEYQKSIPMVIENGEYHTPYIQRLRDKLNGTLHYFVDGVEIDRDTAIKISCSCAAQVSYRKNDTSIEKSVRIFDKLVNSKPSHSSCVEHCATPIDENSENFVGVTHFAYVDGDENKGLVPCSGNFMNWIQYRQLIADNTCYKYEPPEN